jgi:RNA polymerase sigma-70 factor (ECF subfamily)
VGAGWLARRVPYSQIEMKSRLQFGQREWQLAYRVALRVLKTADQAEDAAQEALMNAYTARDRFAGRSQPDSWLYRIAHNTALSHLRKPFTRRYAAMDVGNALEEDARNGNVALPSSPESSAMANELAHCMEGCLDNLRPKDRLAFTERFIKGTSERELGKILGVSTNAAKQRAFRARRAVRSCVVDAGLSPRSSR